MASIKFDQSREMDLVLLGRVAIDFNPKDYFQTLEQCTTFIKYLGGSPANIAVGLSRLGKKTGFFARVSDDQFGDFCFSEFQREGVDTSRIRRCENGEKLGLTFTEILSREESSILMYRENIADLSLTPGDIDKQYIQNAKALLISGTALAQSPSREAALKALMLAKAANTPVIFDIDYRPYNWVCKDDISVYYSQVAMQADVILGSREEYDLTMSIISPESMSNEDTADYFHKCGAEIVVIKHGKQGSTAYTRDGESYTIKPFPVESLKGFGGGDGYASAFIYGLLEGLPVIESLELGSASASMLVRAHGCAPFMPSTEELKAFIAQSKEKHGEMVARG